MKILYPDGILKFILLIFLSLLFSTPVIFIEKFLDKDIFSIALLLVLLINITVLFFLGKQKSCKPMFYPTEFHVSLRIKDICILILIVLGIISLSITYRYLFKEDVIDNFSLLYIIGAVFIGPIVEEWVFRGIFLKSLLTRYSSKKSIIISSAFFAVVHFHPVGIVRAFILGAFFGDNYVKNKSLLNVIILHMIANIIGMALIVLLNQI
ncbi:MAG: CPBP family intramembrane glutamic endopeptidase [bacterium]